MTEKNRPSGGFVARGVGDGVECCFHGWPMLALSSTALGISVGDEGGGWDRNGQEVVKRVKSAEIGQETLLRRSRTAGACERQKTIIPAGHATRGFRQLPEEQETISIWSRISHRSAVITQ